MRPKTLIVLVLLLLGACLAAAKEKESVEQLKARVDSAKPQDRVDIYMEIARRQLDEADKLYEAGDSDKARALVEESTTYAEKAGEAAIETGKHAKRTEIDLRKLSTRMRGIWHSLAVEDRPPVQAASDRLEKLDSRLLDHMFQGKKK